MPATEAMVRSSEAQAAERLLASKQSAAAERIGEGRRVAVLTVHHVLVGDQNYFGGAEKYASLVVQSLCEAGAAVHVGYSGADIYEGLARSAASRLTVERTDWINDALSGDARLKPRTILDRRRWLRRTKADTVFVVQQAGGGAFAASLVAARSLGLRVVMSLRQQPEPLPVATGKRWLGVLPSPQLWRRRLIWRRRLPAYCCEAIICNSRRVAMAYCEEYGYPAGRVRVIPNGETAMEGAARIAPRSPCNIGVVGRVTQAKGADLLLEAFALMARRRLDANLTYYGDGPLVSDLRTRASALGLAGRVRFAGYVRDRESIYREIDVYVQPSRRESMSNSVIEAMARGIPCVVADVGGLPETVVDGRNGFVVPPEEPPALAEAIHSLLADHSLFSRFSAACLDRVRRHFDLGTVMRQTVETILHCSRTG